ncbi:MAG TPA: MarR family winged helix-turn-helix transcriptional regulator [Pirellulales bacterium]|jgi:DNA-binding MarR family transcriptional regulator|nr:MarR family winged helix-turn-helix transcriptional regulator [Pirellulales bacterium]
MAPKRSHSAESSDIDRDKCIEIIGTCACFNFRKASRSVTQLFDQILAPIGLRSTQLTILVAAQVLGPCGLARLARELVMDRSTITRNIHPLVTQGLLQVSGKSGRGGKSVEITRAGQQALLSALPYWKEAQGQLLQRMGKDRLDRVMVDLGNVVDATRATS